MKLTINDASLTKLEALAPDYLQGGKNNASRVEWAIHELARRMNAQAEPSGGSIDSGNEKGAKDSASFVR